MIGFPIVDFKLLDFISRALQTRFKKNLMKSSRVSTSKIKKHLFKGTTLINLQNTQKITEMIKNESLLFADFVQKTRSTIKQTKKAENSLFR